MVLINLQNDFDTLKIEKSNNLIKLNSESIMPFSISDIYWSIRNILSYSNIFSVPFYQIILLVLTSSYSTRLIQV